MRILILLFYILVFNSLTQAQEKLYYFYGDQDSSTIGVRNDQGKVIIKPQKYYFGIDEKEEILGATIEFNHLSTSADYPEKKNYRKDSPVTPCGLVYNRKGEFLYYPQLYDNGPDYFVEGLRRYVADGKIGFADDLGNKIIPAKWGFATPFNYGYAEVYDGEMTKKYEAGGEHWTVLPANDQVITYLINVKGERVEPQTKKIHPKDYLFEEAYYPYPFQYSKEEQAILDELNQNIVGIALLHNLNFHQYEYEPVQLEITERPNEFFSNYTVKVFQDQTGIDDKDIYVDAKTKEAFVTSYSETKTSLKDVIIKSIEANLFRKGDYINPKTRKLAEEEVKRLRSLIQDKKF